MPEPLTDAFVDAARSADPGARLAAVAKAALAAGTDRATLLAACEDARAALDDVAEDHVLDLMDQLTGWCAPGAAL